MRAIAVHGGAGKKSGREAKNQERLQALQAALDRGRSVLDRGGRALEAAAEAVRVLEDSPLFNAGRGSVLNHEGKAEMDAALMRGSDREAGAVAGVRTIKNPILLAARILEDSPHVFLIAEGAESWAREKGLETRAPEYFVTEERLLQLERALAEGRTELDHTGLGTVGAVVLDDRGELAAAVSTGGLTNKAPGRVGDSSLVGAGLYAEDGLCAIAATGRGEYFMRIAAAHRVAALMQYAGLSLERATEAVLNEVREMGGEGGFIALDAQGNIHMPFNSETMFRASLSPDGKVFLSG